MRRDKQGGARGEKTDFDGIRVPLVLCGGFVCGVLGADGQADAGAGAGIGAGIGAGADAAARFEGLAQGTGILEAGPLSVLLAAASLWLVAAAGRTDRRWGARRFGGIALAVACLVAGTISFAAGWRTFSERLAVARADRARAEAASPRARLVEGRVASRESRAWGERIRLADVRSVDGFDEALPGVLELTLYRRRLGAPSVTAIEAREVSSARQRTDRLLMPGERVRLAVRIQPVRGMRNPGSPDPERAAARRGVGAIARIVDPGWVIAIRPDDREKVFADPLARLRASAERWRADWRARVLARLASVGALPALVPALALGDRSSLRPSTLEAFRELGLSHLIALSGLHIAFIAGLSASGALLATGLVCRGRGPFVVALVVGCLAAAGFAWWVGASRSVQRAALAFALFALPRAAGRALRPEAVLVWVAWLLALADPAIVFDPAARLSFAACAGLLLAQPGGSGADPDGKAMRGRRRTAARESISAGLVVASAAGMATAPLVFANGGSVAPWAPLANAVAVPFTGLLVLPGAIAAAFGASSLPGATLRLLVWPAGVLEAVAVALAGRLPARPPSIEAAWSIESIAVLVVIGLLALRRRRVGIAAGCWLAVSMMGGTPLPAWPALAPPPRVLFFDMGQGDAVLIEGRSGRLLVDSGGGPPDGTGGGRLLRALRAVGVSRIDALVITHADMDHRGGARAILAGLEVEALVLPNGRQGDAPLIELAERAKRAGGRVRWLAAGERLFAGADLRADVIWPERGHATATDSRNDASLVLQVELAGHRLLLMADTGLGVERALIAAGRIEPADVLKLGHHGSRHSTGEALLSAATPRIGVLTAPCDARRGLPSRELFARLEDERARLLWTGRDGAIALLLRRPGAIEIERWASPRGCRAGGRGEARGLEQGPR